MRAYAPLNRLALEAFDELTDADVEAHTYPADPFLACFRTPEERTALLEELEQIQAAGQDVKYDVLTGHEARTAVPSLSSAVGSAVRLHDQRYLNPPAFLRALATAVRERGGHIVEATNVTDVEHQSDGVRIAAHSPSGAGETTDRFDSVVLANGAWLPTMARRFGVRQPVQAGRGYSFSVACDQVPASPVYFPTQRVACTPLATPEGPRLRVAGMMEFRAPDAALDRRRITAIVEATRPLFTGVDLDRRHDEWVGSRPCTADGLPLIGATTAPRVFVAGGHGMWGIALGPLTGKLLDHRSENGTTTAELVPFDPLR
jgi:D-amino-acid dehydrogenase